MKIAICFSGQPRFVKECFPNIEKFVIDNNKNHQVDIFSHTWFSDEIANRPLYNNEFSSFSGGAMISDDVVQIIDSLYKPRLSKVDKPMSFNPGIEISNELIRFSITPNSNFGMPIEEFQIKKTDGVYSMMYSLMQSIILKKNYELESGIKYDFVVKLRYDNIITTPISFDHLDNNYFYSQEMGKPHYEISDWINFSSSKNMDLMGSIYIQIDNLIDYSVKNFGGWSAESLIKSFCLVNKIDEKTLNLNTQLPRWGKL